MIFNPAIQLRDRVIKRNLLETRLLQGRISGTVSITGSGYATSCLVVYLHTRNIDRTRLHTGVDVLKDTKVTG